MGFILIGIVCAFTMRRFLSRFSRNWTTAAFYLIIVLGIIAGLFFPVLYGKQEIIKSVKLSPVSGDSIYLIKDDDYYIFKCDDDKDNFIGTDSINSKFYEDYEIRVTSSYLCQIQYCVEYPRSDFFSFALLKFPRMYYEFLIPKDAILKK